MNTSHYPSLELCKKLTAIGFPETEKVYCSTFKIGDDLIPISTGEFTIADEKYNVGYVCPSLMELIDTIYPKRSIAEMIKRWESQILQNRMGEHPNMSLPDFLVNELICLHENNYISFSK